MRRLERESITDGRTAKSKPSQALEFLLESRSEKQQIEQFLPQKGELVHPLAVYNTCPAALGRGLRGMGLGWCWVEVFLYDLTSELNEIVGVYGQGD